MIRAEFGVDQGKERKKSKVPGEKEGEFMNGEA